LFQSPYKIESTHSSECAVPNPFKEFGYEQINDKDKPLPFLKMREILDFFDANYCVVRLPSQSELVYLNAAYSVP
jgi:hypothetical protein